jgi:hypothetical protein
LQKLINHNASTTKVGGPSKQKHRIANTYYGPNQHKIKDNQWLVNLRDG